MRTDPAIPRGAVLPGLPGPGNTRRTRKPKKKRDQLPCMCHLHVSLACCFLRLAGVREQPMREEASPKKDKHSAYFQTSDEARAKRWSGVLSMMDLSIGTLWWVDEPLWIELLGPLYDRHSTREGHPGLSLRREPTTDLYSQVSMFHGTTGRHGPLVVSGITTENGQPHQTSFGRLLAPVPAVEWTSKNGTRRVSRSKGKPRLDSDEVAALEAFLKRRMPW